MTKNDLENELMRLQDKTPSKRVVPKAQFVENFEAMQRDMLQVKGKQRKIQNPPEVIEEST